MMRCDVPSSAAPGIDVGFSFYEHAFADKFIIAPGIDVGFGFYMLCMKLL